MITGYDTETLHKGPEMSLVRDDKGLWTGSQSFGVHRDSFAALVPARGSAHPDFDWLTAEGVRVTGEEAGWLRLDVDYVGFLTGGGAGGEEANEPSYRLDLSLSEEPLETHPRYADVLTADDIQEAVELARSPKTDDDGVPVAADTTGWDVLKIELYDHLRGGFESFRDPKVTWTKEWVSEEQPSDLNEIGEIDTPDGDPPAAAANRNWLFTGLTSVQRGGIYENSKTWDLSGRGGWDVDIYS